MSLAKDRKMLKTLKEYWLFVCITVGGIKTMSNTQEFKFIAAERSEAAH
jgi:hypothetical protein